MTQEIENQQEADDWTKIEDAAATEIHRATGGSKDYLHWFASAQPTSWAQFQNFLGVLDRGHGFLPIECFRTLLDLYVASHKHLFSMFEHRGELARLKQPIPTWLA
jgi:hypothetical protein